MKILFGVGSIRGVEEDSLAAIPYPLSRFVCLSSHTSCTVMNLIFPVYSGLTHVYHDISCVACCSKNSDSVERGKCSKVKALHINNAQNQSFQSSEY